MFAVVRLRGELNLRPEIKDTLAMLRLHRINHCVVLRDDPQLKGMIQKVKDYVAWGEIDERTLAFLLEKRGRLSGNRRLTEQFIKEKSSYGTFPELAGALHSGTSGLRELGIKPLFRLHPARKGLRTTKKTFAQGGDMGFRPDMADFIKRMG